MYSVTIFGAVAELEREYILQRQKEGIAIAKKQGKYTGRKPLEQQDFDMVIASWKRGEITQHDFNIRRTIPMVLSSAPP